jgi:hypothetical protein
MIIILALTIEYTSEVGMSGGLNDIMFVSKAYLQFDVS